MLKRVLAFAVAILAVLSGPVLAARTQAIVIGINQYSHVISLDGAVNDARDIAAAL